MPIKLFITGGCDAFVTKLNTNASGDASLLYSTYLGGNGSGQFPNGCDAGYGIAVDTAGNAYVTGVTSSINFPTVIPFRPDLKGGGDAFVSKISFPPPFSV